MLWGNRSSPSGPPTCLRHGTPDGLDPPPLGQNNSRTDKRPSHGWPTARRRHSASRILLEGELFPNDLGKLCCDRVSGRLVFGLHHDTHHRLGSRRTQKHTTGVTEGC